MQSLFIVSPQRSLSTLTYRVCRDTLRLRGPAWVASGEILNHDLHLLGRWPKLMDEGHKFITEQADPARFERATEFLETVARPEGWIYKDVVNPFVVARWPRLGEFRVLKIRRDLAEVAHALLSRGWHAAANAGDGPPSMRTKWGRSIARHYAWATLARRALRTNDHARATAMLLRDDILRGLIRVERTIESIPGLSVEYADLIEDESALQAALTLLYPDARIPKPTYIDEKFVRKRDEGLRRNETRAFARIRRRLDELRAETD